MKRNNTSNHESFEPRLVWHGREECQEEAAVSPGLSPEFHSSLANGGLSENDVSRFCDTGHQILIGDNLEWLKILRAEGRHFDFVYTDPPYNTGQPLTYLDKHRTGGRGGSGTSAWLSVVFPRFLALHAVLSSRGVLFVSIDDREVATLRMILDEIFGRDNFIGTLKWKKKRKPSFLDKHIGITVEYILVYAKNSNNLPRLLGEVSEETTRPVLNASNAICERVLPEGFPARCKEGFYPAGEYKNRTLSFELLDPLTVKEGRLVSSARIKGRFRISQSVLGSCGFITEKFGLRRAVAPDELGRRHATDLCADWPTNEDAENELRSLFGERVFDYPKPVGLISRLLDMYANSHETDLRCLDLFAGSGSLGAAVVEQNIRQNRNHSFCLIQTPEPIRNANRSWQTISDLLIARIEKILPALKSDSPVRVFTLS